MYVEKPGLIEIISSLYPDRTVSATDDNDYNTIVWEVGTPVPEATLLTDQLNVYRSLVDEKIRDEANLQRMQTFKIVLGTLNSEQIRMYEEKYEEASAYLILNSTPTPILDAETAQTGETVPDLAALVVAQYDSAKASLKTMWGTIEGIRRSNINTITAYTTVAQLEAYAGPTWPY